MEQLNDAKQWIVAKFNSDGTVRPIPKPWLRSKLVQTDSGEKETVFLCLWTEDLLEDELIRMALEYEPHGKTWKAYPVQVLARANTVNELTIKEKMARENISDIDNGYQEYAKQIRKQLKKKKLDKDFTSGQGFSTTADENDDSETDDSLKVLQKTGPGTNRKRKQLPKPRTSKDSLKTVEKSDASENSGNDEEVLPEVPTANTMFEPSVSGQQQQSLQHIKSKTSESATKPPRKNEIDTNDSEQISSLSGTHNVESSNTGNLARKESMLGRFVNSENIELYLPSAEEKQNTWYVVKLQTTNKWHVVPTHWINFTDFTCSYPPLETKRIGKNLVKPRIAPGSGWQNLSIVNSKLTFFENYQSANSVRRAAKQDEEEDPAEDPVEEVKENNETSAPEIANLQKTAAKTSATQDKQLSNRKQSTIEKSSLIPLTDAELNKIGSTGMLKLLYRQNEEILKSHKKLLIELQSRPATHMGSSTGYQLMKHPFQIVSLKELNKIEEKLKMEQSLIDEATKKGEEPDLPADSMIIQVKNFFNSQGGACGHKCLTNTLSNALSDKIQAQFNMQGTVRQGRIEKLAFEDLELWRQMKDVVVSNYIGVDKYTAAKATKSCSDWLKGAPERIKKAENKPTRKEYRNAQLLERIRQEEEEAE